MFASMLGAMQNPHAAQVPQGAGNMQNLFMAFAMQPNPGVQNALMQAALLGGGGGAWGGGGGGGRVSNPAAGPKAKAQPEGRAMSRSNVVFCGWPAPTPERRREELLGSSATADGSGRWMMANS